MDSFISKGRGHFPRSIIKYRLWVEYTPQSNSEQHQYCISYLEIVFESDLSVLFSLNFWQNVSILTGLWPISFWCKQSCAYLWLIPNHGTGTARLTVHRTLLLPAIFLTCAYMWLIQYYGTGTARRAGRACAPPHPVVHSTSLQPEVMPTLVPAVLLMPAVTNGSTFSINQLSWLNILDLYRKVLILSVRFNFFRKFNCRFCNALWQS